jgi:hypothetical protein
LPHFLNGTTEIATVKQDGSCGNEVERSRARLLVFKATIPEAAEPVEGDRSCQAVARFALVQLGGYPTHAMRAGNRSLLQCRASIIASRYT